MKAIVQDRYGPASALRLAEVPRPVPGAGQVLVRVHAASVHADVWHMVRGLPYVLRIMGGGLRRPSHPIPGTDMAGVVEQVGPGATRFQPGDAVFGEVVAGMQWRNGGAFAEYVAAAESALEPKPEALSFTEAAAIPTSALIALYNLRAEGTVHPGDRVLVNGAAGGVGMFVVQLAKAGGAHVTAVDAGDRLEALREIGADEVIDYRQTDFTQGAARYDAVIDIPGNHPYSRVKRVLTPHGRYVLIGHDQYGAEGRRWLGSLPRVLGLALGSLRSDHLPRPDFAGPGPDAMPEIARLAAEGRLRPLIDRTYPLAEAAAAIEYLESGQAHGKVVLTV
jgi:NADPH:quinone reductase-like Zn-dependent oxidoreductase